MSDVLCMSKAPSPFLLKATKLSRKAPQITPEHWLCLMGCAPQEAINAQKIAQHCQILLHFVFLCSGKLYPCKMSYLYVVCNWGNKP